MHVKIRYENDNKRVLVMDVPRNSELYVDNNHSKTKATLKQLNGTYNEKLHTAFIRFAVDHPSRSEETTGGQTSAAVRNALQTKGAKTNGGRGIRLKRKTRELSSSLATKGPAKISKGDGQLPSVELVQKSLPDESSSPTTTAEQEVVLKAPDALLAKAAGKKQSDGADDDNADPFEQDGEGNGTASSNMKKQKVAKNSKATSSGS